MSDKPMKRIELPDNPTPAANEPIRKTPHCHRAGRNTPQGVRHVGGVGSSVVYGLMRSDSGCGFCETSGGRHSKGCPAARPSRPTSGGAA